MRGVLASIAVLISPTTVFSETNAHVASVCGFLQQSTTTSLIAIQDMGLELGGILTKDLEHDKDEDLLRSLSVLNQGSESFQAVLRTAMEAQEICKDHFEPTFVEAIQEIG